MFNTFLHAIEDIRRWLKEDRSSDARFSMMVDLYGLPHDFPGYDEAMALNGGERQADSMEAALTAELQDDRFIPYLQVYEFEALVLCDVAKLNELHEEADRAIQRLAEKCSPFQSPEEIDHGRHSHPKARIKGAIPRYDENVHGPLIAGEIGLAVLREKCPHFGGWLRMLEELDR